MKVQRMSRKSQVVMDMLPKIVWATIRDGKRFPYYSPSICSDKSSSSSSSSSSSHDYFVPNPSKIYPFLSVFSDDKHVPTLYQKPLVLSKHLENRPESDNMYICLQMVFCNENCKDIGIIKPPRHKSNINGESVQRRSNIHTPYERISGKSSN
jgi:hypothetical protein